MLAGNKKVGKGLLMVVLSYLAKNDEAVTVHFLSMDMSETSPAFVPPSEGQLDYINNLLKSKNKDSSIRLYDVGDAFLNYQWQKKFKRSSYTPYALARLFADSLPLPDKVLYLDTDTLILGSLSPLYHMDMGEHEFGACLDQLGTFWIDKNYQNSGVLLLNMKKAKETGLLEKCRVFLQTRHPILADQDALNHSVQKKLFLPQKYNEQKRTNEETVIRHFSKTLRWLPFFHTVSVKPWDIDKIAEWDQTDRFDEVIAEYRKRIAEFESL